MKSVAIVGGGPGGLFAAHILETTCGDLCDVTVIEALDRVGGKVSTRSFKSAPILYEAGVAELYDYSRFSGDPVRELVAALGLSVAPLGGPAVILGDKILNSDADIRKKLGPATLFAIDAFHENCEKLCDIDGYYEGYWREENRHPWANRTFASLLNEIPDENARRYIATAAHTDIAVPPHLTSALNGVKNVLMDNDGYMQLYGIKGGNEQLMTGLAARIKGEVLLNSIVSKVGKGTDGRYRVSFRQDGQINERDFDFVVMALPNTWLQGVDFDGRKLRVAMEKHLAHYDRPAHYLRLTCLFKEPFWRKHVKGSFFMQDVFGGACLYDEGARHDDKGHGVLGWLIAGTDALAMANLTDKQIIHRVLGTLPKPLAHGRELFIEGNVHRWVGTVNAIPGGNPMHELRQRHQPEPEDHPGILTIGDYLFDSTVNGVYDSADAATDVIMTELRREKYMEPEDELVPSEMTGGALGAGYHDEYAGDATYEESYEEYFCEYYTTDLIRTIWGAKPPYKLLDVGSATGITLGLFDKLGVEAWGIENSEHIHARTLPEWKHRNFLGDVRALPFEDASFDFIYDTCLCYLPEHDIDAAISELFRVVRKGVFFGGITSDMTREVIERHELFRGVQTLWTTGDWSERFMKHGFRMAITNPKVLTRAWKIECSSNEGDYPWYPDQSTLRACFFSKPADLNKGTASKGNGVQRHATQPELTVTTAR